MATDSLQRRALLQIAAAAALGHCLPARAASAQRFAAAWESTAGGWRVGVLEADSSALAVRSDLEVPTRAHGLLVESPRSVLAVARRPGDWMVRWSPADGTATWAWIEPDRAFNGHVIASADGRHLYTTETNLETGAGLVGVRDAASLEKVAEWASGGMDPHELLLDADGSLLVANGGIPTLPETGRLKIGLERMDASLARLDTADGGLRGQWRVDDPRLSLRHIAFGSHAGAQVLGIALQAEHADMQQRATAPVLALFDGKRLRAVPAPRPLAGYGGDIAFAAGRFAVACTRGAGVALYGADGGWQGFAPLAAPCPLATSQGGATLWAGGDARVLSVSGPDTVSLACDTRLDNHWIALSG